MTSYAGAEAALHALARLPIDNTPPRSGQRLRAFLDRRGNPQSHLQIVIVAGTCGKGSTAACIASMLRACGERVGLFTGPHLTRYTERIVVDGRAISPRDWSARIMALLDEAEGFAERPSVLEVLAVAALEHFRDAGVRWAVMEAGVGGSRDYTMGLDPDLSVLTRIDLDHMHLLGNAVGDIAEEKCGVVRAGESVVSAAQSPAAHDVIVRRARVAGAPLWIGDCNFWFSNVRCTPRGTHFDFSCIPLDVHWDNIEVSLAGAYQAENAATALAAVLRIWTHGKVLLTEEKVRRGLRDVRVAARMELFRGAPDVLLDGAHQPAGARALRDALEALFEGRPLFLVLGVLGDKDREGVAQALIPHARRTWLTAPPWADRAGDGRALDAWAANWRARVSHPVDAVPDWRAALSAARTEARQTADALVLVTGSLYLVGAVRSTLSTS